MACERCSGNGKTLPGTPCSCGFGRMRKQSRDPWIVRETPYGRWKTLSRPHKAGVALGALILLSGLVGAGVPLVASSLSFDARTTRSGGAGAGAHHVSNPSLILPTHAPALPEPTPSGSSASSTSTPTHSRSAEASGTQNSGADPKPEPAQYSAWVGHGCASGVDGGYAEYGRYSDGIEGWYTVDHGGYDGGSSRGGCHAVVSSHYLGLYIGSGWLRCRHDTWTV